MNIASYPCLDFSGGVRRDIGQAQMQKNELLDARNVHLNEKGRVKTRLGSQQLGQTLTGNIENSIFYYQQSNANKFGVLIVNNNASTSVLSILNGCVLTSSAAVGGTTLAVDDSTSLAASGTVEIEGDLIAYTGKAGTTSLTGVTGITFAHASGMSVQQWATLAQSGTAVDGRVGITYAVLNGVCIFTGIGTDIKSITFVAGTLTVADAAPVSEPSLIDLVNYRDRIYGAGAGNATPIGESYRVFFSSRGDGTAWNAQVDYFDVGSTDISGFKVHSDTLGIFKQRGIYTYNEIELKERIADVGAYNQKVIHEIDNKVYTFCENGVFVTNLFSAKSIGEPVKEFFKYFTPVYDTTVARVVTNTHAWVEDKSYFLYINDITVPTVTNDAVLEYNTVTHAWTVHDGGYTNFLHVNNFPQGRFGTSPLTFKTQFFARPILVAGDSGGKVWRLGENRFVNASNVVVGSDIYVDLRSDTGTPIPVSFETQMYDLTHPELFKKFKRLRVLTESGQWNLEYRVEDEQGVGPYKTLGSVSTVNKVLPFPSEAQGWACGFRISGVNTNGTQTFNGIIFEDTEVVPRP